MISRLPILMCCLALAACGGRGDRAPRAGTDVARSATCAGSLSPTRAIDRSALAYDVRQPSPNDGLSATERTLYEAIMAHRASIGLGRIPLSRSLTAVAGRHAEDVARNIAPSGGFRAGTNAHSWSDVDYYADHRNARLMWQTPARLGTAYCDAGYEIAGQGYGSPAAALAGWIASEGHRTVIENDGIWSRKRWRAIGVGHATLPGSDLRTIWYVWFGEAADPAGAP